MITRKLFVRPSVGTIRREFNVRVASTMAQHTAVDNLSLIIKVKINKNNIN